jgi:tetratricopeptide (TPR) repeat protein
MDKISFKIPSNNINKNEIINVSESTEVIKTDNIKNDIVIRNNISDYVKIAPNVYRFGKHNFNLDNDIYVLYSNACQVKHENKFNAIEMFKQCYKLINNATKKEVNYEICVNLALLLSETDGTINEISNYYEEALKISSDRAEPYYYYSIYCNKIGNFEKSYNLLKDALSLSYDDANVKYPGTQFTAYGKYLYDELAVSCYWLKKFTEAKLLLEKIIDDHDFIESRERLMENLELTKKELSNK